MFEVATVPPQKSPLRLKDDKTFEMERRWLISCNYNDNDYKSALYLSSYS